MRHFTNSAERARMVPAPVRAVLDLLNMRPNFKTDARIAGGAVRDALMGHEPKDWDVATILMPMVVVELARRAGMEARFTENSLKHGTVTLRHDDMDVEVTTLRIDQDTDGRNAEVEFTTDWQEDAARRDLTINAMFMDADGTILDFFGGENDLRNGLIKFVGDPRERIKEDFLRILRFFRFWGKISGTPDALALEAIEELAPGLTRVSGERIWMELSRILSGHIAYELVMSMKENRVLAVLGMHQVNREGLWIALCMNARPETVLAAMVNDPATAEHLVDLMKLSNREADTLRFATSLGLTGAQNLELMDWKKLVFNKGKDLALQAICLTSHAGWRDDLTEWKVPEFPVRGDDLMALGVKPGPEMGRILRETKQMWLDADFGYDRRKLLHLAATVAGRGA